jgi:hypothetical protein
LIRAPENILQKSSPFLMSALPLKESLGRWVAVAIFNLRHRQNNEKSAMLVAASIPPAPECGLKDLL